MSEFEPAYLGTIRQGALGEKIRQAWQILESCVLCPRRCRVNRLKGELGICKTARQAWVSSFNPHFGEEAPLVGKGGSGTIFFTHCNLLCNFCQNYDISHLGQGQAVDADPLAAVMLELQAQGCHNINLVTPSHVVPPILSAIEIAAAQGLNLPLVYNSGGYDSVHTLRLLDGVVDIYMPDFKFWDPKVARDTCNAPDYPETAQAAIVEMHRQVGELVIDADGIARRGLLIRHLVLPGELAGTESVLSFIAKRLSPHTYVNIMPQYRPCGRAAEIPELSARLSPKAYATALETAATQGLTRLDQRPARVFFC